MPCRPFREVVNAHTPMGQPEDPNRATLLQILRELNKSAETAANPAEDGLELAEIKERLQDFSAVKKTQGVAILLGLLVQNQMVVHDGKKTYSWVRQRDTLSRYLITPKGKDFLRENVVESGRIA